MNRYKPTFSIREIGKVRFYGGLVFGVLLSITLFLFFVHILKTQFVVATQIDYGWNELMKFQFESTFLFFMSMCSTSMGFCFTSQFWLSNTINEKKSKLFRFRVAKSQINFVYYVVIYVLIRYLLVLIGIGNYNYYKIIKEEYTIVAYLLPTFIFLYNWNMIATVYQSLKAQFLSIPIWLGVSYLISLSYYLV